MPVKLAIRITDMNMLVHIGGEPEVSTHIVEIENEKLEQLLKYKEYTSKSISIVHEGKEEEDA